MAKSTPPWNPYQTFVWEKKVIESWIEFWGHGAFFNGKFWEIQSKRIAGSKFFKVWFEEGSAT